MGLSFSLHSDRRRAVSARLFSYWEVENETGRRLSVHPSVLLRASSRVELSLEPGISWNMDAWQYVGRHEADGRTHHMLARLDQTEASLTTRLSYTFTPDLSLQLYVQPFVSAGDYSAFKEVTDPRARGFEDRFRTFRGDEIAYDPEAGRYTVDLDGDRAGDLAFSDPDFSFEELRSNLVLRWEYRPGSTLFLVWSQGRTAFDPVGTLALGRVADRLFSTAGTNVLLLKLNYWLAL